MAKSRKQNRTDDLTKNPSFPANETNTPLLEEASARDSLGPINVETTISGGESLEKKEGNIEMDTNIDKGSLEDAGKENLENLDPVSANNESISIKSNEMQSVEPKSLEDSVVLGTEDKKRKNILKLLLGEVLDTKSGQNVDITSTADVNNTGTKLGQENPPSMEKGALMETEKVEKSDSRTASPPENENLDFLPTEGEGKGDGEIPKHTEVKGVLDSEHKPEVAVEQSIIGIDGDTPSESKPVGFKSMEITGTTKTEVLTSPNTEETSTTTEDEIQRENPTKGSEISNTTPLESPTTQLLPLGWSLQNLGLELPLAESETIVCISAYEANLYIGTSHGQLLHLYIFDDADLYMLILQISVIDSKDKVAKILPVPDAAMCLVLAGKTVHSYTLPELTPCRIGKIKDAEDMLLLSVGKLPTAKNKSDKVIVYTPAKLRVVQLFPTGLKLLRDINYIGATLGLSSATGTLAHYSNICLVASEKRYDVVDMQQARKIPLFDYNPASEPGVSPYIVPYMAQDMALSREEYLLAVCTDPTSSMAMFINSDGDVTRGTLTWMDLGYPYTGISVDWPYVVGVFLNGPDLAQKIVFSSLESLEIVCELEHSSVLGMSNLLPGSLAVVNSGKEIKVADFELLRLRSSISCISRKPVSPQKQLTVSKTVFSNGRLLFCLQKTSQLEKELLELLKGLEKPAKLAETLTHGIEFFSESPSNDPFLYSCFLVLLLLKGKFSLLQKIILEANSQGQRLDPRLLMIFCLDIGEFNGTLWVDFHAEAVFFDIRDRILDAHIKQNQIFYKWLIREVYAQGEYYDEVIRTGFRSLFYTETCTKLTEVLEAIDQETAHWLGQNATNDNLVAYFEDKQMYFVLLHIYNIKQTAGNPFDNWPLKIIDLSLDLLAETKLDPSTEITQIDDVFTVGTYKFNLPKMVFHELREHVEDETVYTKKLLRLLQLRPDNGLALLKTAKGNKHVSTHKFILDELSKSYKFDSKFSLLKIEYTEQSFLEISKTRGEIDFTTGGELLADYADYLNQDDLQMEYENLSILYLTYQLENDLKDPLWPKVTWIEYLHLHYRKGECEEFFEIYLKVYELMVLHAMSDRRPKLRLESTKDAVCFLNWVFDESADREYRLREIKDYSTAEWLVFYTHPPVPRSTFILKYLQGQDFLEFRKQPREIAAAGLKCLIEFYLELQDPTARNSSVMHAVNVYGCQHLSIDEMLQILPQDFPLMYVEKYFAAKVLELEKKRSDVQLKKALSRANGKLHKAVLKDFQTTQNRFECFNTHQS